MAAPKPPAGSSRLYGGFLKRKQQARAVVAAVVALVAVVLSACSQEHAEAKARDLGISFIYSLAGHDGKFCDLLDTSTADDAARCKEDEARQALQLKTNPEPIPWSPKIYQMVPGKDQMLGIVIEYNRAGKQEFVAVESVRRGDSYKILRWAYPDAADFRTDRAITRTFGW